jgi:hypothetical protein
LLPSLMAAGILSPAELGLAVPGPRVGLAPPSPTKVVYGMPLEFRQDTENFSVQWEAPAIDPFIADQVGWDMEAAWEALVEEQGWQAPVSSDAYLLTVILDPDLGGTGLTATVSDDAFPAGVPVIYVNPDVSSGESFRSSVSAHEFAHALQFAVRDWYTGSETESWYWEASAEWQAELALPGLDTYAWSAQYYAAAPHADHFSMAGYHQYGMFLLNAYLDEYVLGSDGFRDIWQYNQARDWTEEIAEEVGEDPALIWAGFSAAYIAEAFRESDLYPQPITVDGTTTLEGWLGTHYIPLGSVSGEVVLDGGVGAVVRGKDWVVFEEEAEIPAGGQDVWLVVVNPDREPLSYTWSIVRPEESDTGTEDDGREGVDLAELAGGDGLSGKACGCTTAPHPVMPWLLLPALAWRRRAPIG